jgi:hypothetical protein
MILICVSEKLWFRVGSKTKKECQFVLSFCMILEFYMDKLIWWEFKHLVSVGLTCTVFQLPEIVFDWRSTTGALVNCVARRRVWLLFYTLSKTLIQTGLCSLLCGFPSTLVWHSSWMDVFITFQQEDRKRTSFAGPNWCEQKDKTMRNKRRQQSLYLR